MSEHVYDNPIFPDQAMEVRHDRGEMEERGERQERVVDIYVSADGPDPGSQQHAVQRNTAQEQHGVSDETKKKLSGLFLVLLCVLLLAVIIGLVKNNSELIKEKDNNLAKDRGEILLSFDQLEINLIKQTRDDVKRIVCESPHGFTFDDGLCYYISKGKRNWEKSRNWCRNRVSALMVINSTEKQDLVITLNQDVWVRGKPLASPTYRSSDSSDNSREENCVKFTSQSREWNVTPCRENYQWICERDIN